MSKKSYQRLQPKSWEIVQRRGRASERRSIMIMSRGIQFISALLFVFGICIGNAEFLIMSAAFAAVGYALNHSE